jgi:hypothetical protein
MPRFYPFKPSPTIFNDLSDSGRKDDSKSVQRLCAIAHIQKYSCDHLHHNKGHL